MKDLEPNIDRLLAEIALGNRAALKSLYTQTSAKLFGVCMRILKDKSDAEDCLQDIYIKIWQKADKYRSDGTNAMAWLVTIARNQSIDRLRARTPVARELTEAVDIADDHPDPEDQAIHQDNVSKLNHCLDELDPERASAVRAAYVEGYSYAELADHHNVPLNTMRTWLRRSLISLRQCLERQLETR